MRWPWRRFEAFYRRHVIERTIEKMERQRDQMIAAYYSNPVWDEKENRERREHLIKVIYDQHNAAISWLEAGDVPDQEKQQKDEWGDDPLFDPLRKQLRREAQAGITSSDSPEMPNEGRGPELLMAA